MKPVRPVGGAELRPSRKEWAIPGQTIRDYGRVGTEAKHGPLPGLAPEIADCPVRPIHVLNRERNQIDLRRSHVPQQFQKGAPLRIGFAVRQFLVILPGNAASVFEANPRPLSRRKRRPRQLPHSHGEVMHAAQNEIRRNRASQNPSEKQASIVRQIALPPVLRIPAGREVSSRRV